MKTIILNSSNYVQGSGNQFSVAFPGNGVKFNSGDKIAVAGIAVYNSTFNITAARGNNKISVIWNAAKIFVTILNGELLVRKTF